MCFDGVVRMIIDLVFDSYLSIMIFTYSELGTQREGEVCGSCFNPETNYDCGKCVDGLECVKDPQSDLLPDLPPRCRINFGKFETIGNYECLFM